MASPTPPRIRFVPVNPRCPIRPRLHICIIFIGPRPPVTARTPRRQKQERRHQHHGNSSDRIHPAQLGIWHDDLVGQNDRTPPPRRQTPLAGSTLRRSLHMLRPTSKYIVRCRRPRVTRHARRDSTALDLRRILEIEILPVPVLGIIPFLALDHPAHTVVRLRSLFSPANEIECPLLLLHHDRPDGIHRRCRQRFILLPQLEYRRCPGAHEHPNLRV